MSVTNKEESFSGDISSDEKTGELSGTFLQSMC